jgi:SAM-dependent methyltransferase
MNFNSEISSMDLQYYEQIRENISNFMRSNGLKWGDKKARLLDIAPHDQEGARPHFSKLVTVETFDLNPLSGASYCGDICEKNDCLNSDFFDIVVCTEVLEHVCNPFAAVNELWRILKPGGLLLASSPFNFRIHGPLPDCWRFTEHGWKALLTNFQDVRITALEDESRFLMPIHYCVTATKTH